MANPDHQDRDTLGLKSVDDAISANTKSMEPLALAAHRDGIGRGAVADEGPDRRSNPVLDGIP